MSKKTPLDAGFIARAAAGIRFVFTGKSNWFDAGQAPEPMAPEEVKGRRYDYPSLYNSGHTRPRQNEAVSFEQLRTLADSYDVLRTVIERRKDQMEKIAWTIQARDVASTKQNETLQKDERIDEAIAFFRRPDKEHSWNDWLRMLLEDLLVIDAPTIYPRMTLGGDLYALELIDGASIKRVLDDAGRTPLPPEAAYQQVLKGLPAVSYTREELLYRPRNNRTYKVYGYSPVEQIIQTVNIALRRTMHQLEYYRSGSVPDALAGVPESWSAEEIQRFQEYWDVLLSGEGAELRKLRFIPGELSRNFVETKQPPLKDQYDEWLARVVCFCFAIEPTPFVVQVNRATAETAREQSLAEGLAPLKAWVKSIIDDVLADYMGLHDCEFVWNEEEAQSPKEQAEIFAMYAGAGILTIDEIRAELGREPLPEPERPSETAETEPDNQEPPEDGEADKLGKAQRPANEEMAAAQEETAALIEDFLQSQTDDVAAQIADAVEAAEVDLQAEDAAEQLESAVDEISDGLNFGAWAALVPVLLPVLRKSARAAAKSALQALIPSAPAGMKSAIRGKAAQWAQSRAAEMVGMAWQDGVLVANPNAEWQITEGTRAMLRSSVRQTLENGSSAQQLAADLSEQHAFSRERARMIARTELARADGMGAQIGWEESGLVSGKEWLTAGDDKVSDICRGNGAAGVIGLNQHFPSGDLAPPSHPNCRCVVIPVLTDDTEKLDKAYNPNQPRDKNGRWAGRGFKGFNAGALNTRIIRQTLGLVLKKGDVVYSAAMHQKLKIKHKEDYAAVKTNLSHCLSAPDYVGIHPNHPNKIMLVKHVEGLGNGKPAMVVAAVSKPVNGTYAGASAYGLSKNQLLNGLGRGYLKPTKKPPSE